MLRTNLGHRLNLNIEIAPRQIAGSNRKSFFKHLTQFYSRTSFPLSWCLGALSGYTETKNLRRLIATKNIPFLSFQCNLPWYEKTTVYGSEATNLLCSTNRGISWAQTVLLVTITSTTPPFGKVRSTNYNVAEDCSLAHAWVGVSEDPVIGSEQKGTAFFDLICK